ncbi:MAG TPA: sigma-70 family RNA polymerase sigma factor [Thermoanaerobaculia bacterium]|jgi:RNA polymerase sigma factor (sigma-70 family)
MSRQRKEGDDISPLELFIRVYRLRPASLAAEADRIARVLKTRALSRNHLLRLRKGVPTSAEKMMLVVAALRSVTKLPIRVTDVFDLEPPIGRLRLGTLLAGANGATLALSIFSPSPRRAANVMNETDEQAGAVRNVEALYRSHAALLITTAICRYRVPPHDADGLVHDIFASFLERRPQVNDAQAYLLGAIKNASRHYWRKRAHEAPFLPEHANTADHGTTMYLDRWSLRHALAVTLARLGDKCRQTLFRFYFAEEQRDSIARELRTTPANLNQLLHTCRRRAREMFLSLMEPPR